MLRLLTFVIKLLIPKIDSTYGTLWLTTTGVQRSFAMEWCVTSMIRGAGVCNLQDWEMRSRPAPDGSPDQRTDWSIRGGFEGRARGRVVSMAAQPREIGEINSAVGQLDQMTQ